MKHKITRVRGSYRAGCDGEAWIAPEDGKGYKSLGSILPDGVDEYNEGLFVFEVSFYPAEEVEVDE